MIQPLKSSKTAWFVYWLDLDEPVPNGADYFLPTLLIVCDTSGTPLDTPDILEELDQVRVENYLLKLFERLSTPDRVTICASEDWEEDAWKSFSKENGVDIRFQSFARSGPDDLQALAQTVVLRFAQEGGPAPRTKDVAFGLVNTALRVRSSGKKIALLRAALAADAKCSSARIELADVNFQNGNFKAALEGYDAVIACETAHAQPRHAEYWTARETRPLLRGIYGRGMVLWHQGSHADAAEEFEHLLRLNPKDHQGARFFVPLLFLLADDTEEAAAFFSRYEKKYEHDYAEPALFFGWALSHALAGHEAEAKEKYHQGILQNIHIAPMLLEEPELPRGLWHPNDRAEPSYASEFIDSYAVLWDREPGALRLLREAWRELKPRVGEIIALRKQMADFQDQRYEPSYKMQWQKLLTRNEKLTDPK